MSPAEAIERLMVGNERNSSGKTRDRNFASTCAMLARGQNPYACILSCADSRVSPELCFDEERGDLFVTRLAGNYVTTDILASLGYGLAVLHSPLIMVLGHTQCGAMSAAVGAKPHTSTLTEASSIENIKQNVKRLQEATPILSNAVQSGKVKVIGGFYDLETGRVEPVA